MTALKVYGIDLEANETHFLFTWTGADRMQAYERARQEARDFGKNYYAFYVIDSDGKRAGCQNFYNLVDIPEVTR